MQYAYKKDGKGERHGDQAERMLAAQAKRHGVQPTIQPISTAVFAPSAPAAMLDGDSSRAGTIPPGPSAPFMNGRQAMPNGSYQSVPPSQQQRPGPPAQPLPAPPSGLPARPPPSQVGYGGPQGFVPPGFNPPHQPGYPPQGTAPPGFGPPPGFAPPGQGPPPGLPPGFQQPNYGRGR